VVEGTNTLGLPSVKGSSQEAAPARQNRRVGVPATQDSNVGLAGEIQPQPIEPCKLPRPMVEPGRYHLLSLTSPKAKHDIGEVGEKAARWQKLKSGDNRCLKIFQVQRGS
jgi:hypothetical protein